MSTDPFNARTSLSVGDRNFTFYRLGALADAGIGDPGKLPYSIRVLLESCLRNLDGFVVTEAHVKALANYDATNVGDQEIPFKPGRVVLQDFTGVPAVVDFAALRAQMQRWNGDVSKVNPLIRADLVIDHSVQIDAYGTAQAMAHERQTRVRAQHRALPLPEVGPAGVRQLHRGAAGHRHRAPGQPRVPRGRRARASRPNGDGGAACPTRWSAPTPTPP